MRIGTVLILGAMCMPLLAGAHGTGPSFEQTVGEYIVDVGYEPEALSGGDVLLLNLGLLHAADRTSADFSSVWVRLKSGERTLLATGVHAPTEGPTTVLFEVPKDLLTLTVSVRYEKNDQTLTETSFDVPVQSDTPASPGVWYGAVGMLVGIFVGVGISWVVFFRKSTS